MNDNMHNDTNLSKQLTNDQELTSTIKLHNELTKSGANLTIGIKRCTPRLKI